MVRKSKRFIRYVPFSTFSRAWAVETLGASGTIASGSDCFTVNNLDASSYTSNGSGPENYNDTSSSPNGTATMRGEKGDIAL